MSDNGIATAVETEQIQVNTLELTAEERQVIEQMRAERNQQAFIQEYRELCRRYGLAISSNLTIVTLNG